MAKLLLDSRTFGGQFASFEYDLLFNRPHAGWVKYKGKNQFVLEKSKFSNHTTNCCYFSPPDLSIEEGQLVELEVGPKERYIVEYNSKKQRVTDDFEYYFVENYHTIDLKIKPHINKNEFIERLEQDWKDAHQDHLGESLAIQLLSCPTNIYGPGGIGSQSFSFSSTKKPLIALKKTINKFLPNDFIKENSSFQYNFIEKESDVNKLQIKKLLLTTTERSYNYLTLVDPSMTKLQIQIPTVIENAVPINQVRDLDYDVLDYILTAHMINPVIEDGSISLIENGIKSIIEQIEPEYTGIEIPYDRNAIFRIAMSLCRMDYKNMIDSDLFLKGKDLFLNRFRDYLELRNDYFRPGTESYIPAQVRQSYASLKLTQKDIVIYKEIVRLANEPGLEWVSCDDVISALKIKYIEIEIYSSFEALRNTGRIYMKQNNTLCKPLMVEKNLSHTKNI